MINTIEEANAELQRVENELARLYLERRHILEVRDYLTNKPKNRARRSDRQKSLLMPEKQRLVDIVRDNPGINGTRIFTIYGDENRRKITFWLSDLRRQEYIENRGGRGLSARWYVLEDEA